MWGFTSVTSGFRRPRHDTAVSLRLTWAPCLKLNKQPPPEQKPQNIFLAAITKSYHFPSEVLMQTRTYQSYSLWNHIFYYFQKTKKMRILTGSKRKEKRLKFPSGDTEARLAGPEREEKGRPRSAGHRSDCRPLPLPLPAVLSGQAQKSFPSEMGQSQWCAGNRVSLWDVFQHLSKCYGSFSWKCVMTEAGTRVSTTPQDANALQCCAPLTALTGNGIPAFQRDL